MKSVAAPFWKEPLRPRPRPCAPKAQPVPNAAPKGLYPFAGARFWSSDDPPLEARAMALGDVDGDGSPELTVLTLKKRVELWGGAQSSLRVYLRK